MGTSQSKMPDPIVPNPLVSYPMASEKLAERLRALEFKDDLNDSDKGYVYVQGDECQS